MDLCSVDFIGHKTVIINQLIKDILHVPPRSEVLK